VAIPKPRNPADDAGGHPIAWFSALLRGVDRADSALIDASLVRLKQLGYSVSLDKANRGAEHQEATPCP
jgi:hypothetical protein